MSIYDIKVKDTKLDDVLMSEYKGKVLLIVNTATGCGFTPQYEGLEELYQEFKDQGFEVLDFPCNQFGHQAPGTNEEIKSFCTLKYNTTFQTFAKVDVNGGSADPLFVFLKKHSKGLFNKAIKWNFTKFLINKQGNVVKRYSPTVTPERINADIKLLLDK